MTVVAARVYDKEIRFAADSQTTIGSRRATNSELKHSKLANVNGMTIGGSGIKAQTMWLFGFARNHAPLEATEIDVSQFLLEFDEFMRQKDSSFRSQNEYLIAYRGKLFRVYDSLSVFEIPEYAAIGSGTQYAIAAMYMGEMPKEAAGVAAALDIYCSGEIEELRHERVGA